VAFERIRISECLDGCSKASIPRSQSTRWSQDEARKRAGAAGLTAPVLEYESDGKVKPGTKPLTEA
jgi:hypothetical protein